MRWYNLGRSWAVSAAGIARIIHAGWKDRGLHMMTRPYEERLKRSTQHYALMRSCQKLRVIR